MGFIIAFALWPQNFFSFLIKHYFNKFDHLEIYFPTVCSIYEVILLPISVILIEFSSLKFKLLIWFWNKVIIFPINCEPSSEIALQLGCVLFTPVKFLLIGGNFKCVFVDNLHGHFEPILTNFLQNILHQSLKVYHSVLHFS